MPQGVCWGFAGRRALRQSSQSPNTFETGQPRTTIGSENCRWNYGIAKQGHANAPAGPVPPFAFFVFVCLHELLRVLGAAQWLRLAASPFLGAQPSPSPHGQTSRRHSSWLAWIARIRDSAFAAHRRRPRRRRHPEENGRTTRVRRRPQSGHCAVAPAAATLLPDQTTAPTPPTATTTATAAPTRPPSTQRVASIATGSLSMAIAQ